MKIRVLLKVFTDFILPQLQQKFTDQASLQKEIDDNYEIYELDDKKAETLIKFSVSVVTKSAPAPAANAASADKAADGTGDAANTADADARTKSIVKSVLDEMNKSSGSGAGKIIAPDDKKFTIPAEVKRVGRLKYFKNAKINGFDPDERAFRFGMWALAAKGSDTAVAYCREHGIGLVQQKLSDDLITKLQSENINASGGFLVPEEFSADLIELKEQYGVARRLFDIQRMSSDTLMIPRRKGGLTAYPVAEGKAGTESTSSWDQVRLTAKDWMVLARMTNQLSADSIISWGDRLAYECGYAYSLKEDQCAFLGDGTSTYGGITGVNTSLSDKWGAGTANVGYGLVKQGTGTTWGAIVLGDFDAVVGSLPQYADTPNAVWVMHRGFYYGIVEKLVQASGGVPSYEVREGVRGRPLFKGYPVEFSQVMPSTTASGQVSALLGDFTLAATFGDRQMDSIAFSDTASVGGESMFERNQTGIRAIERFDINVHDVGDGTTPGPVVGLITG